MMTSGELIVFQRGYYDHYDPDPDPTVTIPIGGLLRPIPSEVSYLHPEECSVEIRDKYIKADPLTSDPFIERDPTQFSSGSVEFRVSGEYDCVQVRWVPYRDEWVVIAYKCEADTFESHIEGYYGPWSIDAYCTSRLLQAYGIPLDTISIEDVKHMSPEHLQNLSM